jgi:hypothetical protein
MEETGLWEPWGSANPEEAVAKVKRRFGLGERSEYDAFLHDLMIRFTQVDGNPLPDELPAAPAKVVIPVLIPFTVDSRTWTGQLRWSMEAKGHSPAGARSMDSTRWILHESG